MIKMGEVDEFLDVYKRQTVDTDNNVVVKVVKCSGEPLVIQKGIMLGLAEKYQPEVYGSVRVVDVLEHEKHNNDDNFGSNENID